MSTKSSSFLLSCLVRRSGVQRGVSAAAAHHIAAADGCKRLLGSVGFGIRGYMSGLVEQPLDHINHRNHHDDHAEQDTANSSESFLTAHGLQPRALRTTCDGAASVSLTRVANAATSGLVDPQC